MPIARGPRSRMADPGPGLGELQVRSNGSIKTVTISFVRLQWEQEGSGDLGAAYNHLLSFSGLTGFGSPLWGVGFRHWVGGVIAEMRRKSPIQQWVDSIPKADQEQTDVLADPVDKEEEKVEPTKKPVLQRDVSFQLNDECDVADPSEEAVDSIEQSLNVRKSKAVLLRDRSTNSEGNSPMHRHPFFRDSSVQVFWFIHLIFCIWLFF